MNLSSATRAALKFAFPQTIPILAGFLFLGIAYGIFMNSLGFHAIYPILMSLFIFAGSMEFVAANLLLISFNPLSAFFLTLMVNARHLFYGISMLDQYGRAGHKKWYLIYGMCDESFAINSTLNIPNHLDKGKVMLFVTLLNQIYWVAGATIGGVFGSFITFNTEGLEFVMTALFVVIFLENWLTTKQHHSALIGLALSALSLAIFGGERFIIPAMLAILGVLTLLRPSLQKEKRTAL
ncbi:MULTISPECIES: AzlC family ABC transporter permease [Bacillales]|uniref:AzlC family ABC transporter permease n=1 Tax=Lysinibacillus louembei TaxID=1470088 RepID=A0ABZ0S3Q5_9BACI|nr:MULTISPECIES: AzlC family ABC transporter permease [Bacillales]MCT6925345.1 AzlC family ABC transporter permease [Metasolibacillus sp.]MCT6941627.1 AzlC family ABC transporter permease [Metasolibacillus sp.]WPK13999.1 AzlC family ABC transporter permease [Lysinibacillus louembei]